MILNQNKNTYKIDQLDNLIIAKKSFRSRLLVGTGKYKDSLKTKKSIEASEAHIVTVAIRRLEKNALKNEKSLINQLDWKRLWLLANTAGSKTADEAIRIAFLGREIAKCLGQEDNNFVKLEVINDSEYLMPDPLGTIKAAEFLITKGFAVLPYVNSDPMLAKHLEELGCSTIMPLGSAIGSNQGLKSLENLTIILQNSKIPVIVDAGIGKPSHATQACELGADAVLMNTVIAESSKPELMATAMKYAVWAGRNGFLAKPHKNELAKAKKTSPEEGLFI